MKRHQSVTVDKAAKILCGSKSIALFAHTRPDGDTIGATVALCRILASLGIHTEMFCDTPLTGAFLSFPETSEFKRQLKGRFDLYVAVDCGDVYRTGEFAGQYDSFFETLTIDHHCGERYSAYSCLYPYSSTCQIVYEIGNALNAKLDEVTATYLYMGLCTDTGNFAHSNTDKDTFLFAAKLKEVGADTEKITRVFFKDTTLGKTRLLGRVLGNIRSYCDGKLILLYITEKDLKDFNLTDADTEGIVQYAVNVDTALVGVSLCQYAENTYKVSMRGKNTDVRSVCTRFGGGGHVYASGCMLSGFFEDVVEKIVNAVRDFWA